MCKTISNKNVDEVNSDIVDTKPTINNKNFKIKNSRPDRFNEELLEEQTNCFVLGYN